MLENQGTPVAKRSPAEQVRKILEETMIDYYNHIPAAIITEQLAYYDRLNQVIPNQQKRQSG
jgi:hypothetical protein